MAWCVDYIDFYILVCDRCIFTEDGDPAFAFEIIAVHDEFTRFLVVAEDLGGVQNFVYQGCFSVVYVGDDCYIPDIHVVMPAYARGLYRRPFLRVQRYCNTAGRTKESEKETII